MGSKEKQHGKAARRGQERMAAATAMAPETGFRNRGGGCPLTRVTNMPLWKAFRKVTIAKIQCTCCIAVNPVISRSGGVEATFAVCNLHIFDGQKKANHHIHGDANAKKAFKQLFVREAMQFAHTWATTHACDTAVCITRTSNHCSDPRCD